MEYWIFDEELERNLEYESNWDYNYDFISEYESKKNEEFIIFIKAWLKYELTYRKNLYSDSFIHAAYQEIEEYPFAPCGLNCYIIPWDCLEVFYDSVNSRLPQKEQFNFEQYIPIEYYNQYDNVSMCIYFGYWRTLELEDVVTSNKLHLCGLTPYDIKEYYKAIDKQLEEYKGKVNCIKKIKNEILKECIDFRQEELDAIDYPGHLSSLYGNSRDWICLEINAIKNKITDIETDAMETPFYANDINIINELENWIGILLDRDHRHSTESFGRYVKLFLKRAFEKDSWQRYLLRKLGVEKSKTYLIAKHYNKQLPFSPIIEND